MKPVVFLSHSSDDNPRAIALQQALVAAGCFDTAFDVQNLRQGVEYRPELYRWMARCHGAVLLITQAVMNRPDWVLQEATLLRARTMLEGAQAFRLFLLVDQPVLAHEVWTTRFAPLELDALQRATLAAPADSIAAFVAQVNAGMQEVAVFGSDHQARLAELIFDRLEPFMAERAGERVLAECLQVDDALWRGIVPAERALQALYARRLASGDLCAFGGLERLFEKLQDKADRSKRLQLLNALRSHWVPLANAARLADALARLRQPQDDEPPGNVLVLHTEYSAADKVALLHRDRRFQPFGELGHWIPVTPGNETAPMFAAKLRQALQAHLFPDEPEISAKDIIEDLADDLAAGKRCFVHLAGVQSMQHVLPVVRAYWPCLFLITARADVCERLSRELQIAPIAPPHADEVRRMRDLGKAQAHIGAA
ncbi:toll/interleukin-1 receptor domain-containing protein [Aquincola sp. S2]|uniref:Toll/interleukin-1 receptor domain-containing protein n=1 Tax=Pseudaquabacterium terrae TaxID=2732868 RepID=A0ABX2ECX2_9BURK|nr:toll/interleukin-1 receptor domain-containing protein [Aquabacterium terrae]NRF65717.1 toll/interleukin-1 receptor domain-containing protein [Aquabacterium terrae]